MLTLREFELAVHGARVSELVTQEDVEALGNMQRRLIDSHFNPRESHPIYQQEALEYLKEHAPEAYSKIQCIEMRTEEIRKNGSFGFEL